MRAITFAALLVVAAGPVFGQTPKSPADPHAEHMLMDRAQTAPPAAQAPGLTILRSPDNGASGRSPEGIAAPRRVGRHQDAVRPGDQGFVGTGTQDKARSCSSSGIFGMGDWARAVGDSLAKNSSSRSFRTCCREGTERRRHRKLRQGAGRAIRTLTPDGVNARLTRRWSTASRCPPQRENSVIGFCWGGSAASTTPRAAGSVGVGHLLRHAADEERGRQASGGQRSARERSGAVVGFCGGNDARVTSAVEPTAAEMKKLGKVGRERT